jgi:hypothetical protein
MFDIDFYQHLVLATWLFMLLNRWWRKQVVLLLVLGIALLWEIAEYFYNLDSYSGFKHYFMDTMFDMLAALIACLVCVLIMNKKQSM